MDPNLYNIYRAHTNKVAKGDFYLAEKDANDYLNYVLGWNFPAITKEMSKFRDFLDMQVRSK